MFLKLNHQRLDIYGISRQFVFECYKPTMKLPIEEKFGMISQIRRAALSGLETENLGQSMVKLFQNAYRNDRPSQKR